ncbi:hypothetical protein DICPUDRAFT_39331 [Dictyostelium purpureum]|uniref:Gamma-secretase subunit Aph-1 n=1 Tax=Dictyostelium purpureum TaxID=5786 RepID=F0ZW59_DICPU|nr:uncharacterized protein DICPUDRAFT_39331 [Dictyostelium purpureum]EGC31825.1 hypothetical protein DICPUDRAFT_39331 [Dictyostelium purpureum]|eukprot:XP_003291659.1 hypothetical protein DICPUDRAFT_39331 [Dictyostelium purpureum]
MTQVLFYGCLFITFSPILAFFFLVIAKNSQLVILTIGGSFFWLVSILLSAIWWYIIPPMREQWWFTIPFAVVFQEAIRYLFYRLYSWGFNDRPSLNQIKETQHQMSLDQMKKRKQVKTSYQNENYNNDNDNNNNNNNDDDTFSIDNKNDSDENDNDKSESKESDKAEVVINNRLETLSARPNHTLSATAIGVGNGTAYGFIMFGSILWESTGPGTMFSPACPTVNLFMLSSIITLCMTILHVVYNVLAFQGYRSRKYHLVVYVVIVHFLTSFLTLLNQPSKSCIGSVLPISLITIFSVCFCLYSLLKSDSITKTH